MSPEWTIRHFEDLEDDLIHTWPEKSILHHQKYILGLEMHSISIGNFYNAPFTDRDLRIRDEDDQIQEKLKQHNFSGELQTFYVPVD